MNSNRTEGAVAIQTRRQNKILGTQGEKTTAHHASQSGPTYQ